MRHTLIMLGFLLGGFACEDAPTVVEDLEGFWDLVGYSDAGVPAATTGSATFLGNGAFTVSGTLTFPGEPVEAISFSGTWSGHDDLVTLTSAGESSTWKVTMAGETATLTLTSSSPPTTITLRRRPG